MSETESIKTTATVIYDWTVVFKNGAKLEFKGSWNHSSGVEGSTLARDVQEFHAKGCAPAGNQSGMRIRYNFDTNVGGSSVAIDVTQVDALLWVQS